MTLLLSNQDIEAALDMPDCLEALEIAYRDLGLRLGGNGIRSEVLRRPLGTMRSILC
jgi:hypothetical protein